MKIFEKYCNIIKLGFTYAVFVLWIPIIPVFFIMGELAYFLVFSLFERPFAPHFNKKYKNFYLQVVFRFSLVQIMGSILCYSEKYLKGETETIFVFSSRFLKLINSIPIDIKEYILALLYSYAVFLFLSFIVMLIKGTATEKCSNIFSIVKCIEFITYWLCYKIQRLRMKCGLNPIKMSIFNFFVLRTCDF